MTEHNRMDTFGQATSGEDTMHTGEQHSGGMAESVRQTAGEAVNSASTRVKEQAGAVADQARQTINQATRQTKSEINNVTSQVRQQADSMIAEQKDMAAGRLGTLASTLRETSRQLQNQEEDTMGRYAEVIADQIDTAADFLRQRNPGDLLGDLQRLAQRQPEIFVAGSLAVGFLLGRFIKGPSRSALRDSQSNPAYYGQGGYQSGYQGSGYQSSGYQGGAYTAGMYQGGRYQSGGYQSGGYQSGGYQSGGYRGSDNPAEGTDSSRQAERFQSEEYQGRYESSGFQGNAFQQGGHESSGYQAEGADPDERNMHGSINYRESYEGGNSAYQTGPTMTEGSDTDYPRYDPNFGSGSAAGQSTAGQSTAGQDDKEDTEYTPSSRR